MSSLRIQKRKKCWFVEKEVTDAGIFYKFENATLKDFLRALRIFNDVPCIIALLNKNLLIRFSYKVDEDPIVQILIHSFIKGNDIENNELKNSEIRVLFSDMTKIYAIKDSPSVVDVIKSLYKRDFIKRWIVAEITKNGTIIEAVPKRAMSLKFLKDYVKLKRKLKRLNASVNSRLLVSDLLVKIGVLGILLSFFFGLVGVVTWIGVQTFAPELLSFVESVLFMILGCNAIVTAVSIILSAIFTSSETLKIYQVESKIRGEEV